MKEPSSRERFPRLNIGLSQGRLDLLKRFANGKKSNASTEATFLLSKILDELEDKGKIPAAEKQDEGILSVKTSNLEAASSSEELFPRAAREIAETYGVSDRSIQNWYKVITEAYPSLTETDLKIGKSAKMKYTVLCQELIQAYRQSGKNSDEWIAEVQGQVTAHYETFAELVMHNYSRLIESGKFEVQRLQALMSGETPSETELLRVALIGKVSEEYAISLKGKNGHGSSTEKRNRT